MGVTTVDRETRDRELCERHLGMRRLFSQGCGRAGCKARSEYAVRVVTADCHDRPLLLCVRHAARRLRRLAMVARPSERLRLACRLAGVTVRQFGDLPGSATARWFRAADAELAGGGR